jgi:hypothetical protein
MNYFSFNSSNRSNFNNVCSNNIPTNQNIKTQNNFSTISNSSVDQQVELQNLKFQVTELHQKLHFAITDTLPNLVKKLIDSKIENLIEEKALNESYLAAKEKTEITHLTKEEVVNLVKNRGDALIDEKTILQIFPNLATIR